MRKEKAKIQIRIMLAMCLLATVSLASCSLFKTEVASEIKSNSIDQQVQIPESKIDLEQPLLISGDPKDLRLCGQIDEIVEASDFASGRWGILVLSLKDGRAVCGRDAQKPFIPASVQKILTSLAAFDKLGGDFRWKTSVYTKSELKEGILEGDLVLYGQGAPDFDDSGINELVKKLKAKGLKNVRGNIVGDESFFTGDDFGDGWTWNDLQWYYGAASSALSLNRNQMTVSLKNGKPISDSNLVELSGEVKPIEAIEAVGVKRELGTNKIFVWGSGTNLDVRIAINKPALLAAKVLKEALGKNGITVAGNAVSVDWRSKEKLNLDSSVEIASVESQTLADIVRRMNKDSVNLYAELILKTLGKKFGDEAPDENPKMQKLRGDDSAGASVIKKWLGENKIGSSELKIHDGSGLSRLNLVTPEAVGKAMVFGAQSKYSGSFKNSLPIAGTDGTLRRRLTDVSGKIIGKTGSIQYVDALTGFAIGTDESFVFVIICNNAIGKTNSSLVIDEIAVLLIK